MHLELRKAIICKIAKSKLSPAVSIIYRERQDICIRATRYPMQARRRDMLNSVRLALYILLRTNSSYPCRSLNLQLKLRNEYCDSLSNNLAQLFLMSITRARLYRIPICLR